MILAQLDSRFMGLSIFVFNFKDLKIFLGELNFFYKSYCGVFLYDPVESGATVICTYLLYIITSGIFKRIVSQ